MTSTIDVLDYIMMYDEPDFFITEDTEGGG